MVRKKDIIFSWNNFDSDIDKNSLKEFLRDDLKIEWAKDVSETVFTKGEVRKDDIASRPESDVVVNGGGKKQ